MFKVSLSTTEINSGFIKAKGVLPITVKALFNNIFILSAFAISKVSAN